MTSAKTNPQKANKPIGLDDSDFN